MTQYQNDLSPGPWRTGRQVHRTLYDASDRLIGVMDWSSDAQLAAAAPDLLEACREVAAGQLDHDSPEDFIRRMRDLCRAAIAKARNS